MSPSDFPDVQAKIDRGYELLQALHQETLAFISRYPYGLRQEPQGDGSRYVGILEIYREPDASRFGILIGDCANSFRTALDYLVLEVARLTLPTTAFNRYERQFAYPICSSQHAWDEALARHRLEGLSAPVISAIEARQPFKTHPHQPDQAALAALLWVNDRDKHQLLHTVAGYALASQIHFEPGLMPGTFQLHLTQPPYTTSGIQILDVQLQAPVPDLQIRMEMMLEIRIRDCPVVEDARELLMRMGQTVQRVVAQVTKVV